MCAPGNYTCASCCDPNERCRCGAGASGHATAPTANATAVHLHLHTLYPDRAAHLAVLSDARAVEAFKGLACCPCLQGPFHAGDARPPLTRRCPQRPGALVGVHRGLAHPPVPRGLLRVRGLLRPRRGLRLRRRVRPGRGRRLRARVRRRRRQARRVVPRGLRRLQHTQGHGRGAIGLLQLGRAAARLGLGRCSDWLGRGRPWRGVLGKCWRRSARAPAGLLSKLVAARGLDEQVPARRGNRQSRVVRRRAAGTRRLGRAPAGLRVQRAQGSVEYETSKNKTHSRFMVHANFNSYHTRSNKLPLCNMEEKQ